MSKTKRLLIATYHRVVDEEDKCELGQVDVQQFEMHIETFSKYFNVLSLSEAIGRLNSNSLPPRAVAITFDDGYKDNVSVALPILRRWGATATFFIASGFLHGKTMWNDIVIESIKGFVGSTADLRRLNLDSFPVQSDAEKGVAIKSILGQLKYLPEDERHIQATRVARALAFEGSEPLMMNEDDVRLLRRTGMEIGAHTRTHPILSNLSDSDAVSEIVGSKNDLEDICGDPVEFFAYPNGQPGQDFEYRHAQMARSAGFNAAFTTYPAAVDHMSNRYQLGRFNIWDRNRAKLIVRTLLNYRTECHESVPGAVAAE